MSNKLPMVSLEKVEVKLTMKVETVVAVDKVAHVAGLSRASVINGYVEDGLRKAKVALTAEDVARIKRETPGMPQCPYVLEFAYLLPDQTGEANGNWPVRYAPRRSLVAIVIPDAENGYNGRWKWHTNDFTPAEGPLAANTEAHE